MIARTLLLTLGVLLPVPLAAEPLAEPPVIGSAGGSLGLLVVAREQRLVGDGQGQRGSGAGAEVSGPRPVPGCINMAPGQSDPADGKIRSLSAVLSSKEHG